MGMYILSISRDISIENLLPQFNYIDTDYDKDVYNCITVDFSRCGYISPGSLTVIASYLKHKLNNSPNLEIIVKENMSIDTYISRVDFYNILEIENPEYFCRHDESGRFITIKNINDSNYGLVEEIMDILVNHSCVSDDIYYSIDWSFNELLDNIFQHSNSQSGAFLIAQRYDDRVEFCITDNGVGIANSLRQNDDYKHLNDLQCLEMATEKAVTVGTGQGNGLYITRRFIESNLGELHIYSSNNRLSIEDGILSSNAFDYSWNGTIITLKVYKKNDIDIFEVFDTDDFSGLPVGYSDSNYDKDFPLW